MQPVVQELHQRATEVVALVREGYSNTTIAAKMGISPKTVDNYLGLAYARYGLERCNGYSQRVCLALMIPPPEITGG